MICHIGGFMRKTVLTVALLLFVHLRATNPHPQISADILNSCRHSIESMTDDEIWWHSDRVWFFDNQTFVLNDVQQWVSLGKNQILRLPLGCSASLSENRKEECRQKKICLREHEGHYYSNDYGIYFCLNIRCPYYYHRNFPDGAKDLVSNKN